MIVTDRDEVREQRNGVQVLARAATLLRLLAADSSGGLTFSELVARSGLPRTTVHRIRGALEHEDFITTDAATGRLHLGPGIMRLAMAKRDLPTVVKPYLEQLSRELNETVDLGVLDGAHVLFIAQNPAPQRSLMVVSRVGARFPAFCTANGKALLALLPEEEVKRRLPKRLDAPGSRRVIGRRELLAELEEIRGTGLAFDREEHHTGICGVGVAIVDIDGSTASISVPMPAARFHEDPDTVAAALLRLRDEVQVALHNG
ncbi:MAG TPA: IclR family transcriptional regulator [Thermoleophilia bacterium]|nr:IclR family transcriptional regulator [Thermoleophilia bacterium]